MTVKDLMDALKEVHDVDEEVYFVNDKHEAIEINSAYQIVQLGELAEVPCVVLSDDAIL